MHRRQKILHRLKRDGYGLEIGPSHRPIAPKKEGYKVHIIDHASQKDLVEKYTPHKVNIDNIEEVDFVWSGQPYDVLTGKRKFYDWIIAAHVIEHTPDLIGFLKECDSVLKDDGVLSLAVPDKRYCFDHFRPTTGLAKIIDNHVQNQSIHTPGEAAEFYLSVVSKGARIAWNKEIAGDYKLLHSPELAREKMNAILSGGEYIDLHSWCFTPSSFRLVIHDLYTLGFTSFKEVVFFPTTGCEFFITLGREGRGLSRTRLDMLKMVELELREAVAT